MTPNQLWVLFHAHHPIPGPDNTEVRAKYVILISSLVLVFKQLN